MGSPVSEEQRCHTNVSAVVIVLNNADQLQQCLASLSRLPLFKTIVVDGGSTDNSIQVAQSFDAETHMIGKTGLAHARQFGVERVDTEYTLLVDSDNYLLPDAVEVMVTYMESTTFVGVAAQKKARSSTSFSRAWEWLNDQKINSPGEKLVIGTPALYKTRILKQVGYSSEMTMGDDTDLCYRLAKAGHKVGTSPAVCLEVMPRNFRQFFSKAYLYGRADYQFFHKFPERRLSIGTHAVRNYLMFMSLKAIQTINLMKLPYIAIYSFARIAGLLSELSANCLRKFL